MLTILLPAAGQSSRMQGADKLLEELDGGPCLAVLARRALKVTPDVIVTLPALDHPRTTALSDLPVRQIAVPDAARLGMSASLRLGAAAVRPGSALMILPADMPEITAYDMARLWAVFQASQVEILQAASETGSPGHPVLFRHDILNEFQRLDGDKGAASILRKHARSHGLLPLDGDRAITDLDTPQEWLAWRRKQDHRPPA